MKPSLLLLVSISSVGCSSVRPAWSVESTSDETRRHTTGGDVIGGPGRYASQVWLGIPFAAPPVGPLRWRAPQPAAPWKAPLLATHYQHACAQPATALVIGEAETDGVLGSEDCLYLNVWAPPAAPAHLPQGDERLPVMVWIHGGANSLGSAANYDLGHLASGQRVLAVSVQYRLGPFGWFRHPALREGADPLDASGNYGTLDLIWALEWVRDNAAAFGGNPDNVTLFGESAGGQNVYSLLVSPRAKGLFHRAIAQSPILSRGTLAQAENFLDDPTAAGHLSSSNEELLRLLVRDQSASDRTAAKQRVAAMAPARVAEYLRAQSPGELLRAYLGLRGSGGLRMLEMPMLFPDGTVLPAEPWIFAFARADGWNRVPVLTGTNREEAKLFLFLDPRFTWKLFGLLPRMRDDDRYEAAAETMSRLWRAVAVDAVAEAMLASGASEVYSYRFDWAREPTKLGTNLSKMLGAAHGMEIPFVHGHFEGQLARLLGEEGSPDRDALTNAMMGYWAEFARTGKPARGGGATLPEWTAYDSSAPEAAKFMTFDAAPPGIRMGNAVEHVDAVVADLMADQRIPGRSEKCEGLAALVRIGFLAAERAALVKECAAR